MHVLLNSMRFQSGIGTNFSSIVRLGTITSYNPSDSTVQVSIQPSDQENPEGSQSGWIPLSTGFIGEVGAPNINDQVVIVFQEGSLNNGIVIGRLYSDEDAPPAVPSGEWWITHPSGSFIKIENNGNVEIKGANNVIVNSTNVTITGTSNVTVAGNSTVSIDSPMTSISNGGTVQSLINQSFENLYNNHTHGGGSPTDAPYKMTSAQLTTTLEAQ